MSDIQLTKRHTFTGHTSGIFCLHAKGQHSFLSGGGDGQVVKWDIQNGGVGQVLAKLDSTIYGMLVDGERLIVGENSRAIHLLDLIDNKVLRSIEVKSPVFSIARVNDQYLIGTGSGELLLFDLDLNYIIKKKLSAKSLRAISTNGSDVALAYSDNCIRILEGKDLTLKHELRGHTLSVFSLAYHPQLPWLVSTGRDAHIRAWDVNSNYMNVRSIPAHSYAANHLVFSPNGKYFASGSMDKTIKIWDATTFALLKVIDKVRYDGHTNSVNKLLWMNFDNLLVSCSDDRSIAVWDIKFD